MQTLALIVALGLATGGEARDDGQVETRRIVDLAIRAAGGETKLKRVRAARWTSKTIVHGSRGVEETTGEYAQQLPDLYRAELVSETGGKTSRRIIVINRRGRWISEDGLTRSLPAKALGEVHEGNHAIAIANNPLQLRRRDLRLTYLGRATINDREAAGIRVRHSTYEDVDVYYDAYDGQPLKSVTRRRDASGMARTTETLYTYHRRVDGVTLPFKATTVQDGKALAEMELLEIHFYPRGLDETVFARP